MTDGILNRIGMLADADYRAFQCSLMPTVNPERVLGVRTPALRRLARELSGSTEAEHFLASLPHSTYEENNLHAFLLERTADYDLCVARLDRFLPFVDNWATCDSMNPRVLPHFPLRLLADARRWMSESHPYTIRFGIRMMMCYFLDARFDPTFLTEIASLCSDEYYVNMMIAWYFATALAKQYEAVLPLLIHETLPVFVHNKAIQKALESRRLSPDQKNYLRTLKIKEKIGHGRFCR